MTRRNLEMPMRTGESGTALVASVLLTVTLLGLGVVMTSAVTSTTDEQNTRRNHQRRLYLAESALKRAALDLSTGGLGAVGTADMPHAFGGGVYWTTAVDNGNNTHTITAHGLYAGRKRVLQGMISESGHVFDHAIFAGNSGADPTYVLDFEGTGTHADEINGDVYSGQDVAVKEQATVSGSIRAAGTVSGATGYEGVDQPLPDMGAMAYEVNHDVNVANAFLAATAGTSAAGDVAFQLPESHPAHILRLNPENRTDNTDSTPGDDYFLEDPYESVGIDADYDGSDAYAVSLPDGTPRVYYIEGNLWIHHLDSFSFKLATANGTPVRATFVVKGNIYISDNLFYTDASLDGVALIAIKNPLESDSGNIYFGDPVFGTLETMNAFMYAENDFYDYNLDEAGSQSVVVNGTMSAGNQVAIQRTFQGGHSKLTVNFDARLKSGAITLPGLPSQTQNLQYRIVGWREMSPYTP